MECAWTLAAVAELRQPEAMLAAQLEMSVHQGRY